MRQVPPFEMMHWAKSRSERAEFSLGVSGIPSPETERFPDLLEGALEENPFHSTGNCFGSAELKNILAEIHGVGEDSILVTDGTSLANYTAFLGATDSSSAVLVEQPCYAIFRSIFELHGTRVIDWKRDPENDWLPSLDELRRIGGETPTLRTVVVSRLHNPSGANVPDSWLEELARMADEMNLTVVFDEVYLDFLPNVRPAHHFSERFLSTGSVTKAYGFGGLRVGWIVGTPERLHTLRELSFYLAVNGSSWAQAVTTRILRSRSRFLDRSRLLASRGFEVVVSWLDSRDDLSWTPPPGGLNGFVKAPRISDTVAFTESLFREKQVAVAPGDHFGLPGWLRISWGAGVPRVSEALDRLGQALDEVS